MKFSKITKFSKSIPPPHPQIASVFIFQSTLAVTDSRPRWVGHLGNIRRLVGHAWMHLESYRKTICRVCWKPQEAAVGSVPSLFLAGDIMRAQGKVWCNQGESSQFRIDKSKHRFIQCAIPCPQAQTLGTGVPVNSIYSHLCKLWSWG